MNELVKAIVKQFETRCWKQSSSQEVTQLQTKI